MAAKSRIEDLLRCPRCKGEMEGSASSLTCSNCKTPYGIRQGDIPIYELYIDEKPGERGRDPEQTWERGKFEQGYQDIGYHESAAEFERQLGIPEEVGRFLFARVKGRMLEWVQPGEGHCVLDVGCGAGYFLYLIREKYRQHGFTPLTVGVEISAFQLSYMVRRMQKEGVSDAVAVHGNGEFLPFADESFDLLTCSEVLEHIRNPVRALTEMRRVLRPGGTLLLSTPSMRAIKGWDTLLAPLVVVVKAISRYKPKPAAGGESYDVPWYPRELEKAIRAAGLEIVAFERNAVIPHYHCKFLPKPLIKPVVRGFEWADCYLKFMLKALAMHFVVRASRQVGLGAQATSGPQTA